MARRGQAVFWLSVLAALGLASQHVTNKSEQVTAATKPSPSVVLDPGEPLATKASLEPLPPPVLTTNDATHVVTVESLRVRSLPSTDSGVLGSLSLGDTISVLGAEGGWALVSLGPDRRGWVSMQFLAEIGAAPPLRPAFRAPPPPPRAKQNKPALKIGEPLRSAYVGTCDCPYDRKRNGARCGGTSAYSRPGGRSPACYVGD
jgi:hypothetical protein